MKRPAPLAPSLLKSSEEELVPSLKTKDFSWWPANERGALNLLNLTWKIPRKMVSFAGRGIKGMVLGLPAVLIGIIGFIPGLFLRSWGKKNLFVVMVKEDSENAPVSLKWLLRYGLVGLPFRGLALMGWGIGVTATSVSAAALLTPLAVIIAVPAGAWAGISYFLEKRSLSQNLPELEREVSSAPLSTAWNSLSHSSYSFPLKEALSFLDAPPSAAKALDKGKTISFSFDTDTSTLELDMISENGDYYRSGDAAPIDYFYEQYPLKHAPSSAFSHMSESSLVALISADEGNVFAQLTVEQIQGLSTNRNLDLKQVADQLSYLCDFPTAWGKEVQKDWIRQHIDAIKIACGGAEELKIQHGLSFNAKTPMRVILEALKPKHSSTLRLE